MTKKSVERLTRDGVISPVAAIPALTKRNFTAEEILQLQEMLRAISIRKFEAAQVKGNTSLVPRGKEIADEYEAIARLLENSKNLWVSQKLLDCGYAANTLCNINLSDGSIHLVDNFQTKI